MASRCALSLPLLSHADPSATHVVRSGSGECLVTSVCGVRDHPFAGHFVTRKRRAGQN
jgi:hypothetical protein